MKRLKLVVIILFGLSLTGCVQEYTVTDNETNVVAEYMAGLLLNSDKNYDQELVSANEAKGNSSDQITLTPVPTQPVNEVTPGTAKNIENSNGKTDDNLDKTKESYTLAQLINNKNFEIKYKSFKLVDSYPDDSDDSMFVLTHSEGCKMLVVTFAIKNKSDKKKTLNLMDDNISYQIDVNSDTRYSPIFPLLENDLRYIDLKFEGGKSGKGILIFEVPDTTKISNLSLIATKESKSATIIMK